MRHEYVVEGGGRIDLLVPAQSADVPAASNIGDAVLLDGPITEGQPAILEVLLKIGNVRYLYLRSPGGYVSVAMHIGELARAHELTTVVEPGQSCLSACVFVFLGGARRVAATIADENPDIGFHSPRYLGPGNLPVEPDSADGKTDCAYLRRMIVDEQAAAGLCSSLFSTARITTLPLATLLQRGIATDTPDSWRAKLLRRLPPPDLWPVAELTYYRCRLAEKYSDMHRPTGATYIPPAQALVNGTWQNIGRGRSVGMATDCDAAIVQNCAGPAPLRWPLLNFAAEQTAVADCPLHCKGSGCTSLPR